MSSRPPGMSIGLLFLCISLGRVPSALGDDPISIWRQLTPRQRSQVEKTLTERLPAIMPELKDYADKLGREVPRWVQLSRDLEAGDYSGLLRAYQNELGEYVEGYLDDHLPQKGMARWVFTQAKSNTDLLRQVAVDIADPDKSWEDVRRNLFNDVRKRIEEKSEETLRNAAIHAIDEIVGKPDLPFETYSPGELYILAVGEWSDYVSQWPQMFEKEATNQLYEIYRLHRETYGIEATEAVIRFQVESDVVTSADLGKRLIRSWSARMTHLSGKLKTSPDKLTDKLLTLFKEYHDTPEGRMEWQDAGGSHFHGWLTRRVQAEVKRAHLQARRQAREQVADVQAKMRAKLESMHRKAAAELQKAIEDALTQRQRDARNAAIAAARRLVSIMTDQNLPQAQQECSNYSKLVKDFDDISAQARSARAVLYNGLSDDIVRIRERISNLGTLATKFESGLAIIHRRLAAATTAVESAEQLTQETCAYAREVPTASSKEEARQALLDAANESKALGRQVERARTLAEDTRRMQKKLIEDVHKVGWERMYNLDLVRRELHQIDAALATLREHERLRKTWNGLYQQLARSADRQELIWDAFSHKKRRVEELFAPHNPNSEMVAILSRIAVCEAGMSCLRSNMADWKLRAEAVFPMLAEPKPAELQKAKDLLQAFPQLFQLTVKRMEPIVAGVERLDGPIERLFERLDRAELQGHLCIATAILGFNRVWVKDSEGFVDPDADSKRPPNDADLSSAGDAVTLTPIPSAGESAGGSDDPRDADLTKAAGAVTRVPGTARDRKPRQPADTSRRPPATTPDRSSENERPLYAVYKVYGMTIPKFSGEDALRKIQKYVQQLNGRTIKISPQARAEISFRVTGSVLKEYREYEQQVRDGARPHELPLFRKGHHYHQLGTVTTQDGTLPVPLLLVFSHMSDKPVLSGNVLAFKVNATGWTRRLVLSESANSGAWVVDSSDGNRLKMGPLKYSGEKGWSSEARSALALFGKRFLSGMANSFDFFR